MISYYFTVPPSKLIIENATPENRLLGTQGQDLTVSCKAEGGKPAPNVVLIIDDRLYQIRLRQYNIHLPPSTDLMITRQSHVKLVMLIIHRIQ